MAKITIEELSGSLKEYLNGLGLTEAQVRELIDRFEDEKIGDISQLSTSEKGSLVGAINELFQSANNGKQLIASAIGEPVSADDTFSAMSSDINGLLSTFKTNMMNNGITVESGDKFKQLIDKIATLADNEGKAIQFASGEGNWTYSDSFSNLMPNTAYTEYEIELTIPIDIDFEPTYIFCLGDFSFFTDLSSSNFAEQAKNALLMNGQEMTSKYLTDNSLTKYNISIKSFTSSEIKILNKGRTGQYLYSSKYYAKADNIYAWYAIGVGEEDTALRDSLASILQEEGVNVTEEDDMASLITKVDSEFTKDNNTINSLTNELAGKVTPAGTAVASDVLSGKTFINSTGELITGTNISYTFSNDTNSNFMYLVYSRLSDVQISEWRSSSTISLYTFTAPFSGTICFSLYGSTYTNGNYGPYFYIYDVTTNTALSDRYHIFSDAKGSPAISRVTANVTEGHSIALYAAGQGSATVHVFYYYGFQVHYPMSQ